MKPDPQPVLDRSSHIRSARTSGWISRTALQITDHTHQELIEAVVQFHLPKRGIDPIAVVTQIGVRGQRGAMDPSRTNAKRRRICSVNAHRYDRFPENLATCGSGRFWADSGRTQGKRGIKGRRSAGDGHRVRHTEGLARSHRRRTCSNSRPHKAESS